MSREDLRRRIDEIERGYEFLLAYAAQGLPSDAGSAAGTELRSTLESLVAAVDGLAAAAAGAAPGDAAVAPFLEVLRSDADASLAAIRMVRSREAIGSQMIDNLNGSIHLRALLTDLFLLDDVIG